MRMRQVRVATASDFHCVAHALCHSVYVFGRFFVGCDKYKSMDNYKSIVKIVELTRFAVSPLFSPARVAL